MDDVVLDVQSRAGSESAGCWSSTRSSLAKIPGARHVGLASRPARAAANGL